MPCEIDEIVEAPSPQDLVAHHRALEGGVEKYLESVAVGLPKRCRLRVRMWVRVLPRHDAREKAFEERGAFRGRPSTRSGLVLTDPLAAELCNLGDHLEQAVATAEEDAKSFVATKQAAEVAEERVQREGAALDNTIGSKSVDEDNVAVCLNDKTKKTLAVRRGGLMPIIDEPEDKLPAGSKVREDAASQSRRGRYLGGVLINLCWKLRWVRFAIVITHLDVDGHDEYCRET